VSISDALQFPIFVKPDQIHHVKHAMKGQKGWIVNGRADLERLSASLPGGDHTFVAQEIVPGPESEILLYCAYFDAQGQPRQAFTGRKLRQYPPGFGSASLVVSEICEEAREISERFLTAIGYQGIAACEFKRDPRDKKLKLIEINPRPSLWFSLANAADKTVMLAAYHDLGGTGVPLPEGVQKTAVGWRYLNRDVYSAYFYSRAQDFLLPKPDVGAYWAAGKRVDAVYCQDDPWPAASEWRSSVGGMIGRLSGGGGADD
jgi:predicted ATP-grasp superfamily ATP-dependent carboligase